MKAPSFQYVLPQTLDEALAALHEIEGARILAGGQLHLSQLCVTPHATGCRGTGFRGRSSALPGNPLANTLHQ